MAEPVYLRLNGIPAEVPPLEQIFFVRDMQGGWCPNVETLLGQIEATCLDLHQALAKAIFGDLATYHALLRDAPLFLHDAGLNSESPLSRSHFEKLLIECRDFRPLNRFLYLYDVRKLVSGIQEGSKETLYLLGEFYRAFNLDELFYPPIRRENGLSYVTSPTVTKIFALMNFFFIRLHSLLDYTTKLVYEVDHMRDDFGKYPKLVSRSIQFGDKRKISLRDHLRSLFEDCGLIREIELVRNFLIHDGFLDDMPKIYQVTADGTVVEKYILMPDRDRATGQLDRYGNRTLFYGGEDKVNLRLPELLLSFQARQVVTLNLVLENINSL